MAIQTGLPRHCAARNDEERNLRLSPIESSASRYEPHVDAKSPIGLLAGHSCCAPEARRVCVALLDSIVTGILLIPR